jgi:3-dehydroquinate synthetase
MKLSVNLSSGSYDIHIEKGVLNQIPNFLDIEKRYAIITDEGVPAQYLRRVKEQLPNALTIVIPQGEESKSLERLDTVCRQLLLHHFGRNDILIALGGGVIGDLVGFVAAIYMRGISYISIPTTTLSQIDSSIGGKTAVNFRGRKNILGSFYQPELVLIDPETLDTLDERQFNSGLIEALKAGLLKDRELYQIFLIGEEKEKIEEIIYRALLVKKEFVESDEKEKGVRKLLNYGHTVGHALESYYDMEELYHGEAVCNGLFPMTKNEKILQELKTIASRLKIEVKDEFMVRDLMKYIKDDKKHLDQGIDIVILNDCEKPEIIAIDYEDLEKELEEYYAK